MLKEQEGTLNQLPEDVLANILQCLAPHFLATSRCVCKPWCTIIDTRRLLRTDLLPLSLAGIFINFHDLVLSEFFSRSSTGPTRDKFSSFSGHCNGLLLLNDFVVNPAMYQWVQLPPFPSPHLGTGNFYHKPYLVFDPAVSPHYEVFLIPFVCRYGRIKLNPATEELEWPLSSHAYFMCSHQGQRNGRKGRLFEKGRLQGLWLTCDWIVHIVIIIITLIATLSIGGEHFMSIAKPTLL